MSGFGFGKGPPLTAEHQAVHEIRADETLALRARIAELEAENEELKKAISKPWMGSARAAYLGEKE
jgi:cell division protein FtsB